MRVEMHLNKKLAKKNASEGGQNIHENDLINDDSGIQKNFIEIQQISDGENEIEQEMDNNQLSDNLNEQDGDGVEENQQMEYEQEEHYEEGEEYGQEGVEYEQEGEEFEQEGEEYEEENHQYEMENIEGNINENEEGDIEDEEGGEE